MALDLGKKKKTILLAIVDLEKPINKFLRKWYFFFLIDIVIFVVIGVLTWLGIDFNAEVQKIAGTFGLTAVGVIFEVITLYNKIQERKKWSELPNQLKGVPDALRRLLNIANTEENIDFIEDLYIKMNQVILRLQCEDKEKALVVLDEVIRSF